MPLGSIRPRFSLEVPGSAEEGIARVVAGFAGPDSRGRSRVLGRHLDIAMELSERRYWSPVVQLEFEEGNGRTVIHGLIGPQPSTWTLYAFVYITVACMTIFGSIFGCAQWILGQQAWGLWSLPVGILIAALMYALSQVGQRLAAEQTHYLYAVVQESLGVPEESPAVSLPTSG